MRMHPWGTEMRKLVKQLREKAIRSGEGLRVIWGKQRDNERLQANYVEV